MPTNLQTIPTITYRYAKHFAEGYGMNWNVGEPPVEGYTSFLWTFLLAIIYKFGLSIEFFAKALGALFWLLTAVVITQISRLFIAEKRLAYLSTFLILGNFHVAFWALSGMETPFAMMLLSLALYATLKSELAGRQSARDEIVASMLWGLSAMTRPEVMLYFAIVAAWKFFSQEKPFSLENIQKLLPFALPGGFLILAHFTGRYLYYGDLLPNTYYAKRWILKGLPYIYGFLKSYIWAFVVIILMFFRKTSREEKLILFLIVSAAVPLINTSTIMGYAHRFFLPILPFVVVLFSNGIYQFLKNQAREDDSNWLSKSLIFSLLFFIFIFPLKDIKEQTDKLEKAQLTGHMPLIEDFKDKVTPETVMAMIDCGTIPFYLNVKVIDLWGLNDRKIAKEFRGALSTALDDNALNDYVILCSLSKDKFIDAHRGDGKNPLVFDSRFQQYKPVKIYFYSGHYFYWVFGKTPETSKLN